MDYFNYYNRWERFLADRNDVDVLLISYEDMKKVNLFQCQHKFYIN